MHLGKVALTLVRAPGKAWGADPALDALRKQPQREEAALLAASKRSGLRSGVGPPGGRGAVLSGPGRAGEQGFRQCRVKASSVQTRCPGRGPPDTMALGSERARDSGRCSDGLRHACLSGRLPIGTGCFRASLGPAVVLPGGLPALPPHRGSAVLCVCGVFPADSCSHGPCPPVALGERTRRWAGPLARHWGPQPPGGTNGVLASGHLRLWAPPEDTAWSSPCFHGILGFPRDVPWSRFSLFSLGRLSLNLGT